MATKTISSLPSTDITGSEVFPVVSSGTTYQASVGGLSSVFLPKTGGQISGNLSTTGSLSVNTTTTLTGNVTASGTLKVAGNISGSATPSTTMTTGFVHIPKVAGQPTGTPTAISGYAPMVYDSTNKKFWIYDSTVPGWKYVTLA